MEAPRLSPRGLLAGGGFHFPQPGGKSSDSLTIPGATCRPSAPGSPDVSSRSPLSPLDVERVRSQQVRLTSQPCLYSLFGHSQSSPVEPPNTATIPCRPEAVKPRTETAGRDPPSPLPVSQPRPTPSASDAILRLSGGGTVRVRQVSISCCSKDGRYPR